MLLSAGQLMTAILLCRLMPSVVCDRAASFTLGGDYCVRVCTCVANENRRMSSVSAWSSARCGVAERGDDSQPRQVRALAASLLRKKRRLSCGLDTDMEGIEAWQRLSTSRFARLTIFLMRER